MSPQRRASEPNSLPPAGRIGPWISELIWRVLEVFVPRTVLPFAVSNALAVTVLLNCAGPEETKLPEDSKLTTFNVLVEVV